MPEKLIRSRRIGPFWKFGTLSNKLEVAVETERWGRVGLRFGIETQPLFSERNQGKDGIPRRFHYAFGGRLTLTRRMFKAASKIREERRPW